MNKIVYNAVAIILVSHLAVAVEVSPVEPIVENTRVNNLTEEILVEDDIAYDGFYLGGALTQLRMNEADELRGNAVAIVAGYYFNKYLGVEARYTRTLGNVDKDSGRDIESVSTILSNAGLYIKPIYNLTTGFSVYGLAGYGVSKVGDLSESGLQWGMGSKYELASGVGFFVDYTNFFEGDSYDGTQVDSIFFSSTNVGATYTF